MTNEEVKQALVTGKPVIYFVPLVGDIRYDRVSAVMGKLLSLGADAYATGGQRNIRITVFPSGKIFAERVD